MDNVTAQEFYGADVYGRCPHPELLDAAIKTFCTAVRKEISDPTSPLVASALRISAQKELDAWKE
jgi:hypothetical protein